MDMSTTTNGGTGAGTDLSVPAHISPTASLDRDHPGGHGNDPGGENSPDRRTRHAVAPSLLIGIVLVAANLRTPLTGVGALLPTIQHGSGLSEGWSGLLNTLPLLTFAATSPLVARASHRFGTSRLLAAALGASLVVAAGFALLALSPSAYLAACTLLGLGGGTTLVLALTFQSQRADSAGDAAALAGMAQSIGYLVAATGPFLLGILHHGDQGWTLPLSLLVALSVLMARHRIRSGTRPPGARLDRSARAERPGETVSNPRILRA